MTLENLSPGASSIFTPRFTLEIQGKPLSDEISSEILEVIVDEKVDEGSSFSITINDNFDSEAQKFKLLDEPLFTEGNLVNIKMGYNNIFETMVNGKITSILPDFFSNGGTTFTLEGHDLSFDYMKRCSPERTFIDQPYSDIAKTIAKEAKLTPVVDDTGKYKPSRRKDNDENYFVFLKRLAEEVSYRFDVDRDIMYFRNKEDVNKELLLLEMEKDIISFRPIMNTTGLFSEVEVRGHNPNDPNSPFVGRAKAGNERHQERKKKTGSQIAQQRYSESKKVITDVVVHSTGHAEEIAKAELNKASDTLIIGEVESIGLPQIRKGINIKLEKMGPRFSGKYYVTSTTHVINDKGYNTNFKVKRNAS